IGMLARAEAFERHDVAPGAALDRDHAGARGDAVDQHRAGSAFAETAAIFRSVQSEVVAQHIKQCGVGRGVDIAGLAVDGQAHRALRHAPPKPSLRCKLRAGCFRKIPFVYKRASRAIPRCSTCLLYEQSSKANEVLCGKSGLSWRGRLDSVSVRAQHHSYTNKVIGPRGNGSD